MKLIINGEEVVVNGVDIYKGNFKIPNGVDAVVAYVEDTDIISGKLIIPDGVTEIAKGAVDHLAEYKNPITGKIEYRYSIDEIKYLNIPKSVKKVDTMEFDRCDSLREIIVPEDNSEAYEALRWSSESSRGPKRNVITGKEKNSNFISDVIFKCPDTPGNMVYLTPDGEGVRKKVKDGLLHISIADGNFMGIYEAEMEYGLYSIRNFEDFVKSIPDNFNGYIVANSQRTVDYIVKYIKENPAKRLEVSYITQNNYRGTSKSTEIEYKNQKVLPDALYAGCETLQKLTIGSGVQKIGKYAFSDCKNLESLIISKGVEVIEDSAFRGCEKLEEVYLPETLKKIGKNAFQDCLGLKKITIPAGIKEIDVGVFKNCINLEEIEIPEGVKVIGASAFENCRKLKITRIPSTVVTIGNSAFEGCESIESIRLPTGVESLGDGAFKGCTELEDAIININLQDVGNAAFQNCSKLSSVIFENEKNSKLKSIGMYTFDGCTSLEKMFIPDNGEQQHIAPYAFRNSGLREISMPSVTNIASEAFVECTHLKEVGLGERLKLIGNYVFFNCKELQGVITIGKNIEYLGEYAFEGCSSITGVEITSENITWLQGTFKGCSSLVSVVLPKKLKTIGERSFEECTSLQEVQVPSSVTEISYNAFENCDKLSMVDIPEDSQLKEIKDEAFKGCYSLESLHLPNSTESLGENTFKDCEGLKEVYASKLISGVDDAFSGCEYVEYKTPKKVYIISRGERIIGDGELEEPEFKQKNIQAAVDIAYEEQKKANEIVNGISKNGITEREEGGLTVVEPTKYSLLDRISVAVVGHKKVAKLKEQKAKNELKDEIMRDSNEQSGISLKKIFSSVRKNKDEKTR